MVVSLVTQEEHLKVQVPVAQEWIAGAVPQTVVLQERARSNPASRRLERKSAPWPDPCEAKRHSEEDS